MFFKIVFFSFLWIWIRSTLPRYRYDKLMYLSWKLFLPVSLNFMLFNMGLSIMIMVFII